MPLFLLAKSTKKSKWSCEYSHLCMFRFDARNRGKTIGALLISLVFLHPGRCVTNPNRKRRRPPLLPSDQWDIHRKENGCYFRSLIALTRQLGRPGKASIVCFFFQLYSFSLLKMSVGLDPCFIIIYVRHAR